MANVCFVASSGLNSPSPYVVPAGQTLMVTSVDIITDGVGGLSVPGVDLNLFSASGVGNGWIVPNDGYARSFTYPSGIAYPEGFTFSISNLNPTGHLFKAYLSGYLTPI